MQFHDRESDPVSVGLFALGIFVTIAIAVFIGLLYRGPGEIAANGDLTRGDLTSTAFYRDTGIVAPARPNG